MLLASWRNNMQAIPKQWAACGEVEDTRMVVDDRVRPRRSERRIKEARDALLNGAVSTMLDPVRDIICEPTRTQIVRVLRTGALSVGELSAILQRSKSATSQHLRVLRDAGVVSARRRGRTVMYSLTSTPMVDATVQVLDTAANFAAA